MTDMLAGVTPPSSFESVHLVQGSAFKEIFVLSTGRLQNTACRIQETA